MHTLTLTALGGIVCLISSGHAQSSTPPAAPSSVNGPMAASTGLSPQEARLLDRYIKLYAPTVTAVSPQQSSEIVNDIEAYVSTAGSGLDDTSDRLESAIRAYRSSVRPTAAPMSRGDDKFDELMRIAARVSTEAPSQVLAAASSVLSSLPYASQGLAFVSQEASYIQDVDGEIEHVITSVLSAQPPTLTDGHGHARTNDGSMTSGASTMATAASGSASMSGSGASSGSASTSATATSRSSAAAAPQATAQPAGRIAMAALGAAAFIAGGVLL